MKETQIILDMTSTSWLVKLQIKEALHQSAKLCATKEKGVNILPGKKLPINAGSRKRAAQVEENMKQNHFLDLKHVVRGKILFSSIVAMSVFKFAKILFLILGFQQLKITEWIVGESLDVQEVDGQ